MYEVMRFGGKEVPMTATAATPVYYKTVFQDDVLAKFGNPDAEIDWVGKLAYIMAKQGAGEIESASYDDFVKWLDKFDPLDIFGVEENNAVITLFGKQQKTTVDAKKKSVRQSAK